MNYFYHNKNDSFCENVSLQKISDKVQTPCYVYSLAQIKKNCDTIKNAFKNYPTKICYAVKANSNIAILKEIAKFGFGTDIVSEGELQRSLIAGISKKDIVFSGVGKKESEIKKAVSNDILSINIESEFEIEYISKYAESIGKKIDISIRVNPNIDARTNPNITTGLYKSKFGLSEEKLFEIVKKYSKKNINIIGISCHIGSQITSIDPIYMMAKRMNLLSKDLINFGCDLKFINLGGGLGIKYKDENPPDIFEYAKTIIHEIKSTNLDLIIEPGRIIMANAAILLSSVIGVKKTNHKNFVIIDAGISELIRKSLYDGYHHVEFVGDKLLSNSFKADIAGPICETTDILANDIIIKNDIKSNSLIFFRDSGAYVSSMESNYNSRPKIPEILVDDNSYSVIRKRENLSDLWKNEIF